MFLKPVASHLILDNGPFVRLAVGAPIVAISILIIGPMQQASWFWEN